MRIVGANEAGRCIAVSFHCPEVQPRKVPEGSVAEAVAAAGSTTDA